MSRMHHAWLRRRHSANNPGKESGIAPHTCTRKTRQQLTATGINAGVGLNRPGKFADQFDQRIFEAIYSRSLVYNTCWEDPAVDRLALDIGHNDTMMVITSAGCNVLDYALAAPKLIHAVDANPRQNALLELKLAAIRRLQFADFFSVFGEGFHPHFGEMYRDALRGELSPFAREYWDKNTGWFASRRGSFYYHGLSGVVAGLFRTYLRLRPRLAEPVRALFEMQDLAAQRRLYDEHIHPQLWGPAMNWALSRQLTMSLLGVPTAQRHEVQNQHPGGVAGFIRASIEYVFRELPVWNNYFWSVYVRGRYGEACCPEYLKHENFLALKQGLADRVRLHTTTVTDFLVNTDEPVSKFVLLDHMDWMASHDAQALRDEWHAILERAAPGARIIFRSAHARPAYLEKLELKSGRLRYLLDWHEDLAARLQAHDRVHTYAGFHIADVAL
jgi:S-adenosylmethionine-diacylglycerol 3-amino-3-carboxypropyl transferase